MNKKGLVVVRGFGKIEGESLDEEKFRALKSGDMIRVQSFSCTGQNRKFDVSLDSAFVLHSS